MAIHRLIIDDFEEANFELIAIHTSLEDFRLAFFINKIFPILLLKNKKPFSIANSNQITFFSTFSFEIKEIDEYWNLIENKTEIQNETNNQVTNLFANSEFSVAATVYLLPELKKPDYFLKIENTNLNATQISEKLNTISKITKAYVIEADKIKSINNLISN